MRDYPCWPGGRRPPRTGRIYDRSRLEEHGVTNHPLDNREESIYGLLDRVLANGRQKAFADVIRLARAHALDGPEGVERGRTQSSHLA